MRSDVSAIILTGGKSTRMGRDKGLMNFRGTPLIQGAIDIVSSVCADVIISANDDSYKNFGLKTLPDKYSGIGPMGGLHACLKASRNDLNIVLAVDMPFIEPSLYDHLLKFAANNDAVVPYTGKNYIEPLAGVYHRRVWRDMESMIAIKNHKLANLLASINTHFERMDDRLPFYHSDLFHNINRPGDATF